MNLIDRLLILLLAVLVVVTFPMVIMYNLTSNLVTIARRCNQRA
jgi:hypothetical protein